MAGRSTATQLAGWWVVPEGRQRYVWHVLCRVGGEEAPVGHHDEAGQQLLAQLAQERVHL